MVDVGNHGGKVWKFSLQSKVERKRWIRGPILQAEIYLRKSLVLCPVVGPIPLPLSVMPLSLFVRPPCSRGLSKPVSLGAQLGQVRQL